MSRLLIITLASTIIVGCSESKKHGSQLEAPKPKVPTSKPSDTTRDDGKYINVMTDKLVKKDIFVTDVNAGDSVKIKAKGFKVKNEFSEVYPKEADTSWSETRCTFFRPTGEQICMTFERTGKCTLYYRDLLGQKRIRLKTPKKARYLAIKARVGERIHNLDKIVFSKRNLVHATIEVTKEMVKDSNDLYLVVTQYEDHFRRIGMLRREVPCRGESANDFKIHASMNSKLELVNGKREFETSVDIKRKE